MKHYVLFRDGRLKGRGSNEELYYARYQNPDSTFVTATASIDGALLFNTARDAYDFGGVNHLDQWQVGQR